MAMASMNLQVQLTQNECVTKFINEQILAARRLVNRDLNQQEQAIFNQELNRLLSLRKRILDDLRVKKIAALHPVPYTSNDESALNQIVNDLLKNNPNYEAPEIKKDAIDPNDPVGAIKGIFSKITGVMGMDKGPFAFIAQLLEKLFEFIFPMIKGFKEMGETMKEKAVSLFHKGKLEDAEVTVRKEEGSGFEKVERELAEIQANQVIAHAVTPALVNNAAALANHGALIDVQLTTYRTELAKFEQKDLLEHPNLDEAYGRQNLKLRIDESQKFLELEKDFSKLHEEDMRLKREMEKIWSEEAELNQKLVGASPTVTTYLNARLACLQTELARKDTERTRVLVEEDQKAVLFLNRITTINADFANAKLALNNERQRNPGPNLPRVP